MNATRYRDLIKEAEESVEYWMEVPITEFTRDLIRLMGDKISRAELARRIDSSRQYITKVLGGNANFTLATMTKLAMAVGGVVHVHIAPRSATTFWMDSLETVGVSGVSTGQETQHAQSGGVPQEEKTPSVTNQSRDLPPIQTTLFTDDDDRLRRREPLAA